MTFKTIIILLIVFLNTSCVSYRQINKISDQVNYVNSKYNSNLSKVEIWKIKTIMTSFHRTVETTDVDVVRFVDNTELESFQIRYSDDGKNYGIFANRDLTKVLKKYSFELK